MCSRTVKLITSIGRSFSTKPVTNDNIVPFVYNRNPRNLEKLRIERKPTGYPLEQVFIEFWHKLKLTEHSTHVEAQLVHNTKKVVVTASTNEWAIYRHLYSKKDKLAYITLARVFAERCLESGMYSFACEIVPKKEEETKAQMFLKVLEEEGLTLKEMPQFNIHNIWHMKKEKKPWTVLED